MRTPRWISVSTLSVALAIFALVIPVKAQLAGKGEIRGTVTDTTGAIVPGAVITLTNDSTGAKQVHQSSDAGNFIITALDPGFYTAIVTAPGFEGFKQENIRINALEIQNVPV